MVIGRCDSNTMLVLVNFEANIDPFSLFQYPDVFVTFISKRFRHEYLCLSPVGLRHASIAINTSKNQGMSEGLQFLTSSGVSGPFVSSTRRMSVEASGSISAPSIPCMNLNYRVINGTAHRAMKAHNFQKMAVR